jgi:hypothetical protein
MEPALLLKSSFLSDAYIPLLHGIDPAATPVFGKMNPRQMVEHMAMSVHQAYGNPEAESVLTPQEHIPKMQAFLQTDKPFRDNTPNALLPDIPAPVLYPDMSAAIAELQQAILAFNQAFAADPQKLVRNPFFGILDHSLSIHLLYKHAWHHLRQFGVQPA